MILLHAFPLELPSPLYPAITLIKKPQYLFLAHTTQNRQNQH